MAFAQLTYQESLRDIEICLRALGGKLYHMGFLALCRSVVKQDVFGNARASYWKFLLDAATRYRHAFGPAVTLAIMGYHFAAVTKEVCQTD